jgi:hypothetical protein
VPGNTVLSVSPGNEVTPFQMLPVRLFQTDFGLEYNADCASKRRMAGVARTQLIIVEFGAILRETGTATTDIDFIVRDNGAEVMASDLTFAHTDADGTIKTAPGAAALDAYVVAAGHWLEIEMLVITNSGTPKASGALAWLLGYGTLA